MLAETKIIHLPKRIYKTQKQDPAEPVLNAKISAPGLFLVDSDV
jgi:hypothetical protein